MSSTAAALKLENVMYEKKGPIAYVTINRPKVLNALNAKTISAPMASRQLRSSRSPNRLRILFRPNSRWNASIS